MAGTRRIALTRDSVCLADDIDAPHHGWIDIPEGADGIALAHAILNSGYLAEVG